jgi:hypothetical protein
MFKIQREDSVEYRGEHFEGKSFIFHHKKISRQRLRAFQNAPKRKTECGI